MNQKYRLMCESWVEKRPEISHVTVYGTGSRKHSIKWKTRYAMLIVSCDTRTGELRFYQKKPRSYTEITDDVIKLQPWQYIVDIPSWIVDKGRPHVLRLRMLPESVIPGQHFRIQIAYQSAEEATAWMRCMQNQTKLTSGIQGHSFGVVAEESSATARIGVAGKHCLLFVSPHKIILAHKTDRSVVCVWPFESVRSYASDDDRRLVIEAGRCSPLGEGVYSFRTRENDDNVLFDLFDHYTSQGAEELKKSRGKTKSHEEENTAAESMSSPTDDRPRKISKKAEKDHPKKSLPSSVSDDQQPPRKPPLPENRATISLLSGISLADSSGKSGDNRRQTLPDLSKNDPLQTEGTPSTQMQTANRGSVTKGLYDLDKLLYNLENTMQLSDTDSTTTQKKTEPVDRSSSYDTPKPSTETSEISGQQKSIESDKMLQTNENAYAINEITDELIHQIQSESSTTDDVFHDAESKPNEATSREKKSNITCKKSNSKPAVAPKPAIRLSKSSSFSKQSKGVPASYPKPVVPYAKVDIGKKTVSSQ